MPDRHVRREDLQHPRFARAYARAVPGIDRRGAGEHRKDLLRPLAGTVMEIGAGSGPSFEHYPLDVESVLALEPDNHLRRLAQQAATSSPVPVTVSIGTAEHLPAEDETIDAVVCSLVLCSVADQATALEEIRRVLRPGGLFAYYEHVRSDHRLIAHAQDTGAGLWSLLAGGCHPNRDTVKAVAEAGLITVSLKRFGFRVHPAAPPVAHVIGLARKP